MSSKIGPSCLTWNLGLLGFVARREASGKHGTGPWGKGSPPGTTGVSRWVKKPKRANVESSDPTLFYYLWVYHNTQRPVKGNLPLELPTDRLRGVVLE